MKQSKSYFLDIEAHFPDPESLNCGPKENKKGPKQAKIAFWSHKSAQRAYFGLKGVKQG